MWAAAAVFALLAGWSAASGRKEGLAFLLPAVLFLPPVAGLFSRRKGMRARGAAVVLAAAAFVLSVPSGAWPAAPAAAPSAREDSSAPASGVSSSGKLRVHFLDVGEGDSEFVELPDGKTMLIDAGNPENGPDIAAYIRKLGHDRIDYLVATHPHSDHIGGMAEAIRSFAVGAVYMPRTSEADTPTTSVYRNLLTAIRDKGLKVSTAKAGVSLFDGGGESAAFVAPNGTDYGDLNQYSAVLLLAYGKNRFLFTGDAGTVSEKEITADVRADVLKVGHHGSGTSTGAAFLKKVSPKYAVIEVGKDNQYGHPAASTLERLRKAGAAVYRTDRLGTVTFTSDGNTVSADKKPAS